jgi:hypothetical protein
MSWFSTNYEKATLGGAAVIALALGWLGWSKLASVDEVFATSISGSGNDNPAVKDADLVPKALQSLKLDRTWSQASDGDRQVDLFTGLVLFVKKDQPDKAIDMLKDAPVHPPIPNQWWVENRIDPGLSDSPQLDPDGDGFSNLEEYNAKTDPNNAKVFPELVAKLHYVKDDSLIWVLRPSFEMDGKFPITYEDSKNQKNKTTSGEEVGKGELFFKKAPMDNRFKMLGAEKRSQMNPRINATEEVTIVKIEDQRHNKKGTVYEFLSPLSEERRNEFLQYDRTAVLDLQAIGYQGREFKIEENTSFALPPDAPKKNYLLKKVTPDAITVEFKAADGSTKSIEIKKAAAK